MQTYKHVYQSRWEAEQAEALKPESQSLADYPRRSRQVSEFSVSGDLD